ncbi:fumarylacetoacetase [Achromobacter deleyi]|uniref:fumarylacetoacetase n=1 Tax=Achromobacter deleyi TaxID=1353891 RepID=UPI001490D814|nr:fumarylacetoacetase [Achromobacter deleyi]QVQ27020.1 fumarylacetoacetase [Achromobacter deleyi]UIP22600.1 fumarylacetoacetase [Achromobacter deleyi]
MNRIDASHDPGLRSWVDSANAADTDFPIQNLPFAAFSRDGEKTRIGVGIGDRILDVAALAPHLEGAARAAAHACGQPVLNPLMLLGAPARRELRLALSHALAVRAGEPEAWLRSALYPQSETRLHLPARIGGFTDFFASIDHATNAGSLFRPDAPLLPNYRHLPVAYNGRANSVRCEPDIARPRGQIRIEGDDLPAYLPSRRLDYEVELGGYVGTASRPGRPVPVGEAWDHFFGFSLLNDWSARDIQAWEYQPLGPFLAKSFATSVSPWVVTAEALAPYRGPARPRGEQAPALLPHLHDAADQEAGALDITLELHLRSARMAQEGLPPVVLSRGNAATLYWTFAQMLAHHTSNGSSLDAGDLLGSGTVSGAGRDSWGSLLEITRGGAETIRLPTGETRGFLADGDEVIITGHCERPGLARIGFGQCRGRIVAAGAQA